MSHWFSYREIYRKYFAKLNFFSFFRYSVIAPVSNRNSRSVMDIKRHTVLLSSCCKTFLSSARKVLLSKFFVGFDEHLDKISLSFCLVSPGFLYLLITFSTLDFRFSCLVDFIMWISGRLTRFKGEFLIPHMKSSILRSGIPPVSQVLELFLTLLSWAPFIIYSYWLYLQTVSNPIACFHLHSLSPGINHHLPSNDFSIHGWVFLKYY